MGNRASRLLAFQLRKAQTNRIISKIKHPISKQIILKPKEIAEAFEEYLKAYMTTLNLTTMIWTHKPFLKKYTYQPYQEKRHLN